MKIPSLFKVVEVGHKVTSTEFRKLEQYHQDLKERIGVAELSIPFEKRFPSQPSFPDGNKEFDHPEYAHPLFASDLLIKDDAFWRQKRNISVLKNIQKRIDIRRGYQNWNDVAAARDAIERELILMQVRISPLDSSKQNYEKLPFLMLLYGINHFYGLQGNGQMPSLNPIRVTV